MSYVFGLGKDILDNYRRQMKFGQGWKAVGEAVAGGIDIISGAKNLNPKKLLEGINKLSNSGKMLVNETKAMKSRQLNLHMPNNLSNFLANQPGGLIAQATNNMSAPSINTNTLTAQPSAASSALIQSDTRVGAGYNPKSDTFNDGAGNTVKDERPAIGRMINELQAQESQSTSINPELLEDGLPLQQFAKGKKINYFKLFQ